MLGVFLLDDEEQRLIREIGKDITGNEYFDPISEQPTQEIPPIPKAKVRSRTPSPVTTTRHAVYSFVAWPLEHMFAAVCHHIRQCATIPRYLILPQIAYYKHLQDRCIHKPFDGTFLFHIASVDRPYTILVYRDVDFHMTLPIDTFLCIN